MRVNVYLRDYVTQAGEKRHYLVIREAGRPDHSVQLGQISRREAQQRRVTVLNELLNGTYQRPCNVRLFFGEFCDKFLAEFASGTRAVSTVALYRECLKPVQELFRGYRLDQIRRQDVERFLGNLGVGNRSKNITLSVLRLIFKKAVEWNYLKGSPVVGIARWREEKGGSRPLTSQELGRVLDIAKPWARATIKVMGSSGMRPGELSQLKFRDIDWENHRLTIVSDHQRKTKNRKSRTIPMSPDLEAELLFLKTNWPNMQYGSGGGQISPFLLRTDSQCEYVFCHRDGRPIRSFRRSIKNVFRKTGVEGVTPHGLRKTFCSMLARQNTHPKVAQRLLGHSDVRLTMDVYTEVQDDQLRDAVNSLPSYRDLQKEKFRVVEGGN